MFNGDAAVAKLVASVLPLLALFQVNIEYIWRKFAHM